MNASQAAGGGVSSPEDSLDLICDPKSHQKKKPQPNGHGRRRHTCTGTGTSAEARGEELVDT